MKVYTIAPEEGSYPVVFNNIQEFLEFVKEELHCGEVGNFFTIKIKEMTEEEFSTLDEHVGW